MSNPDYSGYWTGEIEGTNKGGISAEIRQENDRISGTVKIYEQAVGTYEYTFEGKATEKLSLRLIPTRQLNGIGAVQLFCSLDENGDLLGRWKSELGTEGIFTAKKFNAVSLSATLPKENSVFIVHGHDEGAKHAVARTLEQLGIKPIILQEQINQGMTVIEKFEEYAARAGFAVVLMTPDDYGYPANNDSEKKHRPRQNVVLELGYFAAKLGRKKTFVLIKGDIEMPSDIFGLVYHKIDASGGWALNLAKELKAAGFNVNLNNLLS